MEDEENTPPNSSLEIPPPRLIYIESTQETECRFNPNSLFQLSTPPLIIKSKATPVEEGSPENEEQAVKKWEREIFEDGFNRHGRRIAAEKQKKGLPPAKSEAALKVAKEGDGRQYNPSDVFLSWLNEGTTPRPTTASRKIRLTYSSGSLSETTGIGGNSAESHHTMAPVSSSDMTLEHGTTMSFLDNNNDDDESSSFHRSDNSGSSLSSSVSATFNAIFKNNRLNSRPRQSTRRSSQYYFNSDETILNIPLIDIQNDANIEPETLVKMQRRYGPEFV